jgi:hypothetical protein
VRAGLLTISVLALAGVLLLCGFALIGMPDRSPLVLPDGSRLVVEAVRPAGAPHLSGTRWQRLLYQVLPPSLKPRSGAKELRSPVGEYPVIWLSHQHSAPTSRWVTDLAVVDGMGHERKAVSYANGIFALRQPSVPPYFSLGNFPRREQLLRIRVYSMKLGDRRRLAGEFVVPNPAPGPYPRWAPKPVPARRTAGDLSVTLSELRRVTPTAPPDPTFATPPCEAVLKVERAGREAPDWAAIAASASDATGNSQFPETARYERRAGRDYLIFHPDGAWPSEEAWKLRFELARTGHFLPASVCTLRGLPLPVRGGSRSWSGQVNVLDGVLETRQIVHTRWTAPGAKVGDGTGFTVSVAVRAGQPNLRVWLLRGRDQQGRALDGLPVSRPLLDAWRVRKQGGLTEGLVWLPFRVRPGARSVDLSFAVAPSRSVEFTVAPPTAR